MLVKHSGCSLRILRWSCRPPSPLSFLWSCKPPSPLSFLCCPYTTFPPVALSCHSMPSASRVPPPHTGDAGENKLTARLDHLNQSAIRHHHRAPQPHSLICYHGNSCTPHPAYPSPPRCPQTGQVDGGKKTSLTIVDKKEELTMGEWASALGRKHHRHTDKVYKTIKLGPN